MTRYLLALLTATLIGTVLEDTRPIERFAAASAIGYLVAYSLPSERQQRNSRFSPTEAQLRHQLYTMLNGDSKTALRLARSVSKANPGRSSVWCLEKVIHDLERDRH